MKIDCQLDHPTILNGYEPVHAVLTLTAEKRISEEKTQVASFAILDGRRVSAQNVRVRVKKLDTCMDWIDFGGCPFTTLPDDRIELALVDLISEEACVLVLWAIAMPIPVIDGQLVASSEYDKLLELEILWDDVGGREIKSCRHEQIIRVSRTLNPDEIKLNEETVPWIAFKRAADTIDEANRHVDFNRIDLAKEKVQGTLDWLKRYKLDEKTADGTRLLQQFLARLESGEYQARDRNKYDK